MAANTSSNSAYIRGCREQQLPVHPARFPAEIPRHFIKMVTEPGDTVADFFFGSGQTGEVAEELGRHWIGVDSTLEYLYGAANRFPNANMIRGSISDFRQHGDLFSSV